MPKFGWKAIYEDCIIKQYPSGKPETLFNEIRTKGLPIKFFVGTKYGVNLKTGELLIKGKWQQFGDEDGKPFQPLALLYFRRNQVKVTLGVGSVHDIWHFVGFLHEKGMVRLCIPNDGSKYTICVGSGTMGPEHTVRTIGLN